MLTKEIEQGKYKNKSRIYSMCSVLAQLDKCTINDDRKMEILKVDLQRFKIAILKKVSLKDIIMEILSLSEEEVGKMYLELSNYSDTFPANIIVKAIEDYHFLSELERLSKNKKSIIETILSMNGIEGNAKCSYSDLFEELLENKANSFICLKQTNLITIMNETESISSLESLRRFSKKEVEPPKRKEPSSNVKSSNFNFDMAELLKAAEEEAKKEVE